MNRPRKPRDTQAAAVEAALEEFKKEYFLAEVDTDFNAIKFCEVFFKRTGKVECRLRNKQQSRVGRDPVCYRFFHNNHPDQPWGYNVSATKEHMNRVDALHVAAHANMDFWEEPMHGPIFVSELKKLVERELGPQWRKRLHTILKAHGIKTKTWSKQGRQDAKTRSAISTLRQIRDEYGPSDRTS